MPILSYADRIGSADGRSDRFEESIYLLDEDLTVVGLREADAPDAKAPRIGDLFFTRFPASCEELGALDRMKASISEDSLLMRAGGRPVLILFQFFARTRLLVAVVPQGDVKSCLEAPAAFADVLEAWHVQLSGESRVSGEPLDEQSYALLSKWIARIHLPLFLEKHESGNFDTEVATVAARLSHMAVLCGCRLDYDLTGFGYEPFDTTDLDLLTGTAFCVFLLAHRITKDRAVALEGSRHAHEGPILHAHLACDTVECALPEIEQLQSKAPERDDLFAVLWNPKSVLPLQLEFSFCNKEISAQNVKQRDEEKHLLPCFTTVDEKILKEYSDQKNADLMP